VLREATHADIEMIRTWRNHPTVRNASIWTDCITPEGHAKWWANVTADPARRVLIFSYRDIPCGVVTINGYDPVAGTAEWGFFLDVDGLNERGELLPAWVELEKAAVSYGFDDLKLTAMGGRTLAWNKQVLALHRRFGFVEVPERRYTTTICGEEQEVLWTELTPDRRH
jgi:UDP-4-amino-4,6-dideoxy-N-acetyl-beta-L-altrosamine N-acetyltransferase